MRRVLTRQQVLDWRENWSYSDRELIEHSLEALGEADYYTPPSQQYLCARVGGRVALNIAPGYLYWRSATFADLVDESRFPGGLGGGPEHTGRWYALSTFRQRDEATPNFEEFDEPCPECWMVPSLSGECSCD